MASGGDYQINVPAESVVTKTAVNSIGVPGQGVVRIGPVGVVRAVAVVLAPKRELVHAHALAVAIAGLGYPSAAGHVLASRAVEVVAASASAENRVAGAHVGAYSVVVMRDVILRRVRKPIFDGIPFTFENTLQSNKQCN